MSKLKAGIFEEMTPFLWLQVIYFDYKQDRFRNIFAYILAIIIYGIQAGCGILDIKKKFVLNTTPSFFFN